MCDERLPKVQLQQFSCPAKLPLSTLTHMSISCKTHISQDLGGKKASPKLRLVLPVN